MNFFQKTLGSITSPMTNYLRPITEPPLQAGDGFPFWSNNTTATGVTVTSRTVLQHHAAYACVRTLTADIAKIPLRLEKLVGGGWVEDTSHSLSQLLLEPNDRMVPYELIEHIVLSVLTSGDSFVVVVRDKKGNPTKLIPIKAFNTSVLEDSSDGELYYTVNDNQLIPYTTSVSTETGSRRTIYHSDIIRTRNLSLDGGKTGISLTQLASEAFGLALATQEAAARAFQNGAHVQGFLRSTGPNGLSKTQEDKESISRSITSITKAGTLAIINGYEWVSMNTNLGDLQLVENRKEITMNIAQMYRVPAHKLGLQSSEKAANISEQEESYITNTLVQYTKPLEQHMNRTLLKSNEKGFYRFKFDFSKQAEPNMQIRSATYRDAITYGWMTPNEVRCLEDLAPSKDPDADKLRMPLNTGVAGSESPVDLTDRADTDGDTSDEKTDS